MRVFPVIAAVLVATLAQPAAAGRDDGAGLAEGMAALRDETASMLADLPERKLEELRRSPRAFIEMAADMIYGFGTAGALGPEGIDRYIAMGRAQIRAREIRRFLLADLDDDGVVTEAEINVLIAAEAATSRGRLYLAFRSADTAGGAPDGRVDLDEMRAHASRVALEEIDAVKVDRIRSILLFDLDGDGRVTLPEVTDAVEALTGPV
ncbi:MAG: hypothetical protein KDK53_24350 [Maritimibacter sp.]|nr:hypothetical protein [Maritimibacter sp.]